MISGLYTYKWFDPDNKLEEWVFSDEGGDFLSGIVTKLGQVLMTVSTNLSTPDGLTRILRQQGWDVSSVQGTFDVSEISKAINDISSKLFSGTTPSPDDITGLIQDIVNIVTDLENFQKNLSSASFAPFNDTSFSWSDFGEELLGSLIDQQLASSIPWLHLLLNILGIIQTKSVDVGKTAGRINYTETRIRLDRISEIVNPEALLQDVYGWNSSPFDSGAFLQSLADLINAIGLQAEIIAPDPSLLSLYYASTNTSQSQVNQLEVPLYTVNTSEDGVVNFSLSALPIPKDDGTGSPVGIALVASLTGLPSQASLGSWSFGLTGISTTANALRLEIRPGEAIKVTSDFSLGAQPLGLAVAYKPGTPFFVFGDGSSNSLQLSDVSIGISVNPGNGNEVILSLGVDDAKLMIDLSGSGVDSFIQTILGSGQSTVEFKNVGIAYSTKSGLTFKGSASLQVTIPLNLQLGPITITGLTIGISPQNSNLAIILAVSGSISLGPVTGTVDNIGVIIMANSRPQGQLVDATSSDPANALPISIGFKPPDGIGISIDADVVSGGGYLAYDSTKKEYSGALQLEAAGISLSAYGFLDTVMPGGGGGYSLVLIIDAQFGDPGLEIGFGVALTGIGGLVAVNRTMNLTALLADVQNNTIQNLLFNTDPVNNAPQIISGLAALFPPEQGEFVFGPMVQLQWGPGSIVTANIGVFIELTKAPKVVIVGQMSSQIPSPDTALINLNVDVNGFIDFQAGDLGFDANIYKSYLTIFSISGQMSLRAHIKDNPMFLLSIGGFNPNFQPPPSFPTLSRIKVGLCTQPQLLVNLTCYLAVGSNPFMVGAEVDAYASVGNFYAQGKLGFDALFIFSPFSFTVDICASFAIGYSNAIILAAGLSGTLSGTAPWVIDGSVSFTFLFFHPSVSFHAVVGSAVQQAAPQSAGAVGAALTNALQTPANWSSGTPTGVINVVSINQPTPPDSNTILMDPVGTLSVKQSAVPLATPITAYNNSPQTPTLNINMTGVALAGATGATPQNLDPSQSQSIVDQFAPASYEILTDDQKLSSPSFQPLPGGVTVAPTYSNASVDNTGPPVNYVTKYVDTAATMTNITSAYTPSASRFQTLVSSATAGQSALANSGPRKYMSGPSSSVSVEDDSYVLVSTDKITPVGMPEGVSSMAWSQANGALQSYLAANPMEKGYVQIIPQTEVASS